jgi:glycosyltransferase involved in cell wall biosynthesis
VLPYAPPKYIYNCLADKSIQLRLPPKYFFYPAQLWSHKNHITLLKAANEIRDSITDLKLVFSGTFKNATREIVNAIKSFGLEDCVQLLGYVPDCAMPVLYKRARALIMPTYFGPTNIPPMEAFVAGCPVAVSNIYGMPEQVGNAALLFDPNSVDELASIMMRLWTDDKLCSELIRHGIKRSQELSFVNFEKRFHDIIAKCLADIQRCNS